MLCFDLGSILTVRSLFRYVRQVQATAIENSEIPFPVMWSRLGNRHRFPDFTVLVNTMVCRSPLVTNADAIGDHTQPTAEPITLPPYGARLFANLCFQIFQNSEDIAIEVHYQKSRFRPHAIGRMRGDFQRLVTEILSNPDQQITDITKAISLEF